MNDFPKNNKWNENENPRHRKPFFLEFTPLQAYLSHTYSGVWDKSDKRKLGGSIRVFLKVTKASVTSDSKDKDNNTQERD